MNISVIIPARNMAASLPRAIDSALVAGAGEIVIVNDASDDDTLRIAHRYNGARVSILNTPLSNGIRGGVVFARNYGISFAQNPLVVPLDADDALLPGGLALLWRSYAPNTFVYGGWLEDGEQRTAPPIQRISEKNVSHATWLFHKDDWRAVGGYDPLFEAGCEDWAFMAQLVARGVQAVRIASPIYAKADSGGRAAACMRRAPLLWGVLRERIPGVFHAKQGSQIAV